MPATEGEDCRGGWSTGTLGDLERSDDFLTKVLGLSTRMLVGGYGREYPVYSKMLVYSNEDTRSFSENAHRGIQLETSGGTRMLGPSARTFGNKHSYYREE